MFISRREVFTQDAQEKGKVQKEKEEMAFVLFFVFFFDDENSRGSDPGREASLTFLRM